MIVDVHAHFTYKDYDNNIDDIIKLMTKNGVKKVISNGLSYEDNINVLSLASINILDSIGNEFFLSTIP